MFLAVVTENRKAWTENTVGFIAALAIVTYLLWRWAREIANSPKTPEPWSDEVAAAIEDDSAVPLCIHCLTPYENGDDFCEKCGGPVGDLVNYMPPNCYVSLGYVLRIGSSGDFKKSPGTIAGFFLAALTGGYFIFAPFYWLQVLFNLDRQKKSPPPEDDSGDNPQ